MGGIENVYYDPCQDWLDLVDMKLTSPNYPDPYEPLELCEWTINAPTGHFVTLDLEIIDVSVKEILVHYLTLVFYRGKLSWVNLPWYFKKPRLDNALLLFNYLVLNLYL